ncbi:MAG: very short patch repair endonuclease [Pseudohongiella sp.]|nr:very short patch repair endonuclease [Pseudohongiella sp.]
MTDVHDQATRSRNMSAIKGKDTKPEMIVRTLLFAKGYRYRLNNRKLPGRPDLAFRQYEAAVFVHGCFWHMHGCPAFKLPRSNTEWWREKLESNRQRDIRSISALAESGWRVGIVWECSIRGKGKLNATDITQILEDWLQSNREQLILEGTLSDNAAHNLNRHLLPI